MAMRCSVFASMLMVVGIVMLANLSGISAELHDCGGDLEIVINTCNPFFVTEGPQIPPSQECCGVLKDIDFPCLCQKYFPQYRDAISMQKAIYVGRTCECSVPTGLKCGNYTVPPPKNTLMPQK